MRSFLRQVVSGERGQALPIVLALLVLGGLTIASSLNYATTGLNSGRIISEATKGIYAAEAGVEDALWGLEMGPIPPSYQLQENVNQMEVSIDTENHGTYTIYLGEMIPIGVHNPYLDVDGEIVWDEGAGAYKYTITVTWLPDPGAPVIHLDEIGARLPLGYTYKPWSAGSFAGNLSTDEPDEILDAVGAYMLNWEFSEPSPSVSQANPVETQCFYFIGNGPLENDYTWVVADRSDVGAVGEITGHLYTITATASRPADGKTTARIVAQVISENTTDVISWQLIR